MADRLAKLDRQGAVAIISIEELRQRLDAERDCFVAQVQTQQALDGIEQFLRRQ